MNKLFVLQNRKSWESLLVQDDRLLLSTKSVDNVDDFLESYQSKKLTRFLSQKKEIAFSEIISVSHLVNKPIILNIKYASTKIALQFADGKEMEKIASFINKQKRFSSSVSSVSVFQATQSPLIGIGGVALFGWLTYSDAAKIESGGTAKITGSGQLFQGLIAWLAQQLGTKGTLVVFGCLALTCFYFIYKNYQNPPEEIIYA